MTVESVIRRLGGLLAFVILAIVLYGIWRGTQRGSGRSSGRTVAWLRSPWFYLVTTALYLGISYLVWIPLPLQLSPTLLAVTLFLGSLLYFPGMGFVLWGRLALGRDYFVSTGMGAQLFAGHRLVTGGPFAIVRHPMYMGLLFAAAGSLLIYMTWTTLLFVCIAPFLAVRARREEQALGAEFGEEWQAYCRRVPAFFPRLHK